MVVFWCSDVDGLEILAFCCSDVDGLEMVVFWCLDVGGLEMVVFCCSDIGGLEIIVFCWSGIDGLEMMNLLRDVCVGKFSGMFCLVILVDNFLAVGLLLLLCLLYIGLGMLGLKRVFPDLG